MAKTTKKTKQFGMHPKLLMDVIQRQAGTLGKSVLEAVMNSVDAKATYCDICVDSEVIIIEDDGEGFPSEEMVDKCFNTFGQPHEAKERKTYANFRMGRGQLFSFGQNIWESGQFMFDVDILTRGDKWDFHYDQETGVEGCKITLYLYEPLLPSTMLALDRDIRRLVKWAPIPVVLNDETISQDPSEGQWDYESDNCYVKLRTTGDLAVYNLGMFVKAFGAYQFGRGGEVVSKQQLKLNFARNDVMVNSCPIWKEVGAFVATQAGREIAKKGTLNGDERQRLIDQMMSGELDSGELDGNFENTKLKVLTDVLGRHHSVHQLAHAHATYPCYSNAPQGDRRGDSIHQQKIAFVLADETLDRFNMPDARSLMQRLGKWSEYFRNVTAKWRFEAFEELAEAIDNRYDLVPTKEYTAHEQVVMDLLLWGPKCIPKLLSSIAGMPVPQRKICIGLGGADGWTDGNTFIAIGRDFCAQLKLGSVAAYVRVGELLLHEYCHMESDSGTHTHSPEFYQLYHDASAAGAVAEFAEYAMRRLPATLKRLNKKISQEMARGQDKLHKIDQEMAKIDVAARRK